MNQKKVKVAAVLAVLLVTMVVAATVVRRHKAEAATQEMREVLRKYRSQPTPVLEELIQRGADIHTPDKDGRAPLHNAALKGTATITILLDHGADVNARTIPTGATPLYMATSKGDPDAVRLLLSRGADPNLKTRFKSGEEESPLFVARLSAEAEKRAARRGKANKGASYLEIIKLLQAAGARE